MWQFSTDNRVLNEYVKLSTYSIPRGNVCHVHQSIIIVQNFIGMKQCKLHTMCKNSVTIGLSQLAYVRLSVIYAKAGKQ